jgi:hypothetical protein
LDDLFSYGLRILSEDLHKNTYGRIFVVRWVISHFNCIFVTVIYFWNWKGNPFLGLVTTGQSAKRLAARGSIRILSPVRQGPFSLPLHLNNWLWVPPVGALTCGKAARVWSWALTSVWCQGLQLGIPDIQILAGQYWFWLLCFVFWLDIWWGTQLYHFWHFWITVTNRCQTYSMLVALSFSIYNFALIVDVIVTKII